MPELCGAARESAGDSSEVSTRRPPTRGADRMVAPPDDRELLHACRAGDVDAWELLVARYERLIYSVALRNGLSADDAADITQTTFVELINALDRIRDEERIASWLMTVARRQAWRLRTTQRRTLLTPELPETAEDPFADWGTLTTLHDGLAELGGICRELLQALYFDADEPSYAEIAERLGRSIGGIGPMRGRCLQRLRKIVGEDVR